MKRCGMRAVVNTTVATISHGIISRLRKGMPFYTIVICCFYVGKHFNTGAHVCLCVCVYCVYVLKRYEKICIVCCHLKIYQEEEPSFKNFSCNQRVLNSDHYL